MCRKFPFQTDKNDNIDSIAPVHLRSGQLVLSVMGQFRTTTLSIQREQNLLLLSNSVLHLFTVQMKQKLIKWGQEVPLRLTQQMFKIPSSLKISFLKFTGSSQKCYRLIQSKTHIHHFSLKSAVISHFKVADTLEMDCHNINCVFKIIPGGFLFVFVLF